MNEYVASLRVVDTHSQRPVQLGAQFRRAPAKWRRFIHARSSKRAINEQQRDVLGARLAKAVRVLLLAYPTSSTTTISCSDYSLPGTSGMVSLDTTPELEAKGLVA